MTYELRGSTLLRRVSSEGFPSSVDQFLALLPGVLLIVVAFQVPQSLILPLLIGGGLWILATALVFSVANSVFNTALYVYGSSGMVPSGYDGDTLQGAFGQRSGRGMFG